MHHDALLLKAFLRLARRRAPAGPSDLLARFDGDARALEASLARLAASGLIDRASSSPRLTLAGFAVAVGLAARARPAARRRPPVAARRRAA